MSEAQQAPSEANRGNGASASEPGADGVWGRSPQQQAPSEANRGNGASASEPGADGVWGRSPQQQAPSEANRGNGASASEPGADGVWGRSPQQQAPSADGPMPAFSAFSGSSTSRRVPAAAPEAGPSFEEIAAAAEAKAVVNRRRATDRQGFNWARMFTICRTDLRQLRQSPDFWGPMLAIGVLFFVVVPCGLLLMITSIGDVDAVAQIGQVLQILPPSAQAQIKGVTPAGRASFALSVFLFAPLAVVVPLTISTAIGAATIVGERERGTGEFLAHSPADTREIFVGKLIASLLPGYMTTLVGFGTYSLLVNLIAADEVGEWFFPTSQWLWLMFWVVPPFLGLALSTVLRLSARVRSTIAAQQASGLVSLPLIMLAYSQSTGTLFGAGLPPWLLGAIVWVLASFVLWRGMRAMNRGRLLGVASES